MSGFIYTPDSGKPVGNDNPFPILANGSNDLHTDILLVPVSGTRIQLPDIPCREVTIIAKRDNTGIIFVGDENTSSYRFGIDLLARDSYTFTVSNASMIYVDASISGEGISYVTI